MGKILIVEDDEKLRKELKLFLEKNGYQVVVVEEFENTLQQIEEEKVDLILLDINLPYLDGQYICKEIRKKSNVAIMIITSRDSEIDELISLNNGADQYITKPFHIQILLAKIARLLKRTKNIEMCPNRIDCDNFIINVSKSSIELEEREIELTKNELKIVSVLASNRGNIVSRDQIINDLWDSESFIDDNTLTVNMTRLRTKLEELGVKDVIETKRGQGYKLK